MYGNILHFTRSPCGYYLLFLCFHGIVLKQDIDVLILTWYMYVIVFKVRVEVIVAFISF